MSRPLWVTTNAEVIASGGIEGGVDRLLSPSPGRCRPAADRLGSLSPIGHGVRLRVGQVRLDRLGFEEHVVPAGRQRDAPLTSRSSAPSASAPSGIVMRDLLLCAIDDRLADLLALGVRAGEVADALRRDIRIEPGDEDRRAHRLRVAGGVVLEGVPGHRFVGVFNSSALARAMSASFAGVRAAPPRRPRRGRRRRLPQAALRQQQEDRAASVERGSARTLQARRLSSPAGIVVVFVVMSHLRPLCLLGADRCAAMTSMLRERTPAPAPCRRHRAGVRRRSGYDSVACVRVGACSRPARCPGRLVRPATTSCTSP